MKFGIFLVLFFVLNANANPPQKSIDFNSRLSNSFSTVPVGRQQHRVVVVDKSVEPDDFDKEEKLRQFGCANGDTKCEARLKQNLKKAGYKEKPYAGETVF